jgi:hypothetical protein
VRLSEAVQQPGPAPTGLTQQGLEPGSS